MPELTKEEKLKALREWLKKTRVDASVVSKTVGVDTNQITPGLLLATAGKLIKVNRKEVEPDDRDDLRYSKFLGQEDYVREHIMKDAGRLQAKAKMKMEQKKNLDFFHAGFLSPQVRSVTVGNSLSQNLEGINPIEYIDVASKVTKLGEGGIGSTESIPDQSRQVNPSQFGLIDPFHLSENIAIGVTNYISRGVRKGDDGKLYRRMLDKDKKSVWIDHQTLLNSKCQVPEF
jgi:DNA-directed RNA polymerase beta subunit